MKHFLEQWADESIENQKLVAEEDLILDVSEKIWEIMESRDIQKSDLAKMLNTSRANITQLLDGTRNMRLRTLANIAFALGVKPHFDFAHGGKPVTDWSSNNVISLNRMVQTTVLVPRFVANSDSWSTVDEEAA